MWLNSGSNPDFLALLTFILSWDLFVDELQNHFGPFDESANVERKLTNLQMKYSQCISDYLVCFNSLAVCCLWGEPALRYKFYEGLPAQLKDEICKGDRKPQTLAELQKKVQNIDARYWEHYQEHSREQNQHPSTQQKTPSTNTSTTPQSTSKPAPSGSGSTSQASGSKPSKPKEALKPQSTKLDLSESWIPVANLPSRNNNAGLTTTYVCSVVRKVTRFRIVF